MGWFTIRRNSHHRRRPREGYIRRMIHHLRRILRELLYYARKHPAKIFILLLILPLVTGGALHSLLRMLGIKLLRGGVKGERERERSEASFLFFIFCFGGWVLGCSG
jgi:hypothetical protein